MNLCVFAFPPMVTCGWGTHVLSVTQVGRAGGCKSFAGGCGVVCLVVVFLIPVDSDVFLTASVVLRPKDYHKCWVVCGVV